MIEGPSELDPTELDTTEDTSWVDTSEVFNAITTLPAHAAFVSA